MAEVEDPEKRSHNGKENQRNQKPHSQPSGENLQRKLRVAKELSRKSKRRTKHSMSRRETRVILRSRPETKHHQRQLLNPFRASQATKVSRFQ